LYWDIFVDIHSDEDFWTNDNNIIMKKFAALINFSPKVGYGKDSCSVRIANPWMPDMQNGFGLFLARSMDCSSTVTVECLPGSTLFNRSTPAAVQYTCHTSSSNIEMACSSIELTFKRRINIQESKQTTYVQVVALAKEPCTDKDILFQCPQDYPHSCIDRKLECNGRSECPSGADERGCHHSPPDGLPIYVIVLMVLAFLFLSCILSTVLICCCCRVACIAIIHRFCPGKKNQSIEKGEIAVITGEDAGLMKGLTAPSVIEVLPQYHNEPAPLIIDSTKPVYPRLE